MLAFFKHSVARILGRPENGELSGMVSHDSPHRPKLERIGRLVLTSALIASALVILAEIFFFFWILHFADLQIPEPSFADISLFSLASLVSLMPLVFLIIVRRSIFEHVWRFGLRMSERWCGQESAAVAQCCVALADCLTEDGAYDEAEALFGRAIAINARQGLKSRSAFHVHTELRYLNFLRESGRFRSSQVAPALLELERRYRPLDVTGKTIYACALGLALVATVMLVLDSVAATSSLAGNYGLAREICELAPAPAVLPPSLRVGRSLESLAEGYLKKGQWSKAEPIYDTILEVREVREGNTPAVAEALQLLSEAYLNDGKYKKAQHLLEQAMQIYKDEAGPNDPRIARILNDLAIAYCTEDRYDKSQELLRRALAIYEKHRRPDDPTVAERLHSLAGVCSRRGKLSQAEPLYRLALAVSEENYGPNDPRLATMLTDYASLLRKTNHPAAAQKLEARARSLQKTRHA